MAEMMKVAVMEGIGKMGYTQREIPVPKDNEALVKLEYVGICGSDLHYYETGRISDFIVEPPFVLGHEPGGTVVAVGKDVRHLKPGDRVRHGKYGEGVVTSLTGEGRDARMSIRFDRDGSEKVFSPDLAPVIKIG